MADDRYAGERYDPTLASCLSLELHFDGAQLVMQTGERRYEYPAVSGRPLPSGGFDYSPARQKLSGIGPIPAGTYWINPGELWANAWWKRASTAAWGNFRITIHPFTTSVTHGRGGFFIHGGSTPGSAGCIDLTTHMDRFVGDLRKEGAMSRPCQIHLSVAYP